MKIFLNILLPLFYLALVVGATMYLARRFAVFFDARTVTPYYWFFSLLVLGTLVVSLFMTMTTSGAGHLLYMLAGILFGYIIYLFISTLVVDLLGLFLTIRPLYMGIGALVLATLITSYGLIHAGDIKLTHREIPIKGLSRPIKAVHLTDTPFRSLPRKNFFSKSNGYCPERASGCHFLYR